MRRAESGRPPIILSLLFVLSGISLGIAASENECTECVQLGGVFDHGFHAVKGAFRLAMEHHNRNTSSRRSQVHILVDIISTKDAFKIARLVCHQFSKGVWAMVTSVEPDSFDTLHSYSNTFQVPLVSPSFPENVPIPSSGLMDYALNLQPDYHRAILDVIKHYKWDHIIYLYDSHDGLLRLQEMFRSMQPSNSSFTIRAVQRVSSSQDALECLHSIENNNKWSQKYVVLDSSAQLAKDLIIRHVQDVRMGRRNYHYLLAGLVLDDRWEEEIREFGALNITGFRLIDAASPFVREFLYTWRNLNPKEYPGAGKFISANSALMYDSVRVLTDAITQFQRRNPIEALGTGGYNRAVCDLNANDQHVFRQGEAISRLMRKTEHQGLSGNITFNEGGKRIDFSLDVVEMTVNSHTVKIGSWSDVGGLQLFRYKTEYETPPRLAPRNKVYIITSILEKPFLMLRKDPNASGNNRFEGYAKDLADLLALKVGFNYSLQVVRDNTYGEMEESTEGSWNGMVGELLKKEADVAVAPLTITSARERVIDFTKPFMTQGISIMIKKPLQKHSGVFGFLAPLSPEIWMCIVCASAGVGIVLFLVSRFSPYEWRVEESFNKTTVKNDFTISNSFWFTFGALMRQGIELSPRSFSGRIVGCVWWFFTLILVSSYTANLAAFLTVERMVTPISSADDLSEQTIVEYGVRDGGSTKEFFERSKIPVYAKMWEFMMSRKHVFAKSYDEGIERVRTSNGKYAFILESFKSDFVNEQLPCDTMAIGQKLNTNDYGVATPKGSPLKELLNMAILQLKEDGVLAGLKNKWWFQRSKCGKTRQEGKRSSLSLSSVAGVFYILTAGLVFSLFVAVVEFCYHAKMDASRSKLSLSEAVKAKARMSISGTKDFDHGRSTSSQPLLGQTHLRTSQPSSFVQHHPHVHHQHMHHPHHQQHEPPPASYASRTGTLQGSASQQGFKTSHSQMSFGSGPPPPIQEGSVPVPNVPNAHSSSPHQSHDTANKGVVSHSFADLPF